RPARPPASRRRRGSSRACSCVRSAIQFTSRQGRAGPTESIAGFRHVRMTHGTLFGIMHPVLEPGGQAEDGRVADARNPGRIEGSEFRPQAAGHTGNRVRSAIRLDVRLVDDLQQRLVAAHRPRQCGEEPGSAEQARTRHISIMRAKRQLVRMAALVWPRMTPWESMKSSRMRLLAGSNGTLPLPCANTVKVARSLVLKVREAVVAGGARHSPVEGLVSQIVRLTGRLPVAFGLAVIGEAEPMLIAEAASTVVPALPG